MCGKPLRNKLSAKMKIQRLLIFSKTAACRLVVVSAHCCSVLIYLLASYLRERLHIIGNLRIKTVGKSQSCMVYK